MQTAAAPPTLRQLLTLAGDARKHKRYGDAVSAFDEAVKKDGKNFGLLNNYAWFLVTVDDKAFRDPKRATELARRAVELSGGEAGYILDTLAEALYQNGDLEGAARNASRAAELDPSDEIADRAKRFNEELEKQRGGE